jgi:dienelactone hydrolase
VGAGVLVAAAVVVAIGVARLETQDPFASLPRADPSHLTVVEEWREPADGRTLLHVTLQSPEVGRTRIVVSLPDPMPARRVPFVVVLGGLGGGSDAIREITRIADDPGPDAYVGYDWPLPTREPRVWEVVAKLLQYRRDVLSVPGQVDAIVAWGARQPWVDASRVSLLGISLGAFVVPAAQRLVQERGAVSIRATILGYGGAPIGAVIAGHPHSGPAWLRPVLGHGADLLLRPVEPSFHLPHLRGRFLVLGAQSDQLIDAGAASRMEALTPQPRTVVRIQGDHMGVGPDKWRLLRRVIDVSRAWLLERGAIDPAPTQPAGRFVGP